MSLLIAYYSIYLSLATLFLAQVYNVTLTGGQILTVIGILMVTSKGAAGVTGSGFVVLASTLTAIKVIPVEGLALLLGVDRFMSLAHNEGALDHAQAERMLGGHTTVSTVEEAIEQYNPSLPNLPVEPAAPRNEVL